MEAETSGTKHQLAKVATIKRLPISTIKLIAAGEVITKPVNVVKELLENSIDAGATTIRLSIANGGGKLIEIMDNGHGIARKNAQLLCKRHSTSKLSSVHDLTRISTFGFRGEALASISEMALVYVRTCNPAADQAGWHAEFQSGDLVREPLETSQKKQGTHIKVVNLFSNLRQRKVAKINTNEEKKAIFDLVMRYAIHNSNRITVSLKEASKCPDMLCLLAPMSIKSCLGMFYGVDAEENLIDIDLSVEEQSMFDGRVYVTYKKTTGLHSQSVFILFINNRLIECQELKKEVDVLVAEFVNLKQQVPIVYVTLSIPPADIDVNVHPAKTTVTLHYQEEIIVSILRSMRQRLQQSMATQVMPTASQKTVAQLTLSKKPKVSESPLIRYDRLQLLAASTPASTSMLHQNSSTSNHESPLSRNQLNNQLKTDNQQRNPQTKRQYDMIHNDSSQISIKRAFTQPIQLHKDVSSSTIESTSATRLVKLKSILELRQQVALDRANTDKTNLIKNSTFVGLFDHNRALIQHQTSLYCINFKAYLKEQYYQFYLYDFGNFPPIDILAPGNQIKPFIEAHLKDMKIHEEMSFRKLKFNSFDSVTEELLRHSDMFEDYFTLKLTRGSVLSLPCIIPDEIPNLIYLGKFLVELANNVDYNEERECLREIGRLVADFYSEPPINLRDSTVHRAYHEKINTILYETIKNYLIMPEWLFTKDNICKISDTKDLFKVFERC